MPNLVRFPYNSFRAKPAIATRAGEAKRLNKGPNMPLEIRSLDPKLRRQEGSVKLSAMFSISLATLGAFLGTAIQFHILEDIIAKAQGMDKVSYLEFISRPEASKDYLSVTAAGLIGLVVGAGVGIGIGSLATNKENN